MHYICTWHADRLSCGFTPGSQVINMKMCEIVPVKGPVHNYLTILRRKLWMVPEGWHTGRYPLETMKIPKKCVNFEGIFNKYY